LRRKREAIDGAATQDARVLYVVEQTMLGVVDPEWAGTAPVETPAACVDQRIAENVSEDEANSQGVAFETWLSAQPWSQSRGSDEMDPREVARETVANSRLGARALPANGRETPGRAHQGGQIDRQTASA
jgi:hypothetical protein